MSAFFIEFLPGFFATVCGVILGFPVALYVNFRLAIFQRRHEAGLEKKRRGDVADVIVKSLRYNEKVLGRMFELCKVGEIMRDPDLQLSTWETVGSIFTEVGVEPEVLQILSHHWLRLNNLAVLNREMFDRNVGDRPDFKDEKIMCAMWGNFFEVTSDLQRDSVDIAARLDVYANYKKSGYAL
ncbi:hypothetical protein [Pseudomonas lactucae]|uniref:Uncharacterized protein n=1 Tax=Pseudomonas lactucae TaxID=2813360 RepID=A0A9X0YCJ3_9PSED|nr:hypothetical protein [Pseudomonas lactucae]MBN2976667.1 hypothetical protein [Pseudomonas lactucae]MBN2986903.1 hypothetical protein [Pseudomonas lactucae]